MGATAGAWAYAAKTARKISEESFMPWSASCFRSRLEECEKLLRAARVSAGGQHVLVGIEKRVVGSRHAGELGVFKLGVLFRSRIRAIGIQLNQHQILCDIRDLRPRKHIGLHP